MSGSGYRRIRGRTVYENPWLRFEAHEIVHPTGLPGVHGVVVTPPASAVVVIDGDEVLLVRQPRFAVDAVVLEVIKGGRAEDEDALACAIRETREEAGLAAARWDTLGIAYEIPSIVVILLPATADTVVIQERVGWPSTCTVQAPHSPIPQPNLVPVIPRWSRSTHKSGVSSAAVTWIFTSLIDNSIG